MAKFIVQCLTRSPRPNAGTSCAAQVVDKNAMLQGMLEGHKWRKQTHRTGIAKSHTRTFHTSRAGKDYSKCRVQEQQQSEYPAHGNIYEHIHTMLPEWFIPGEFFGVMLNRNTICQPPKDQQNVGESCFMFLGDYKGGALVLDDGRRFEERGVWHRYDGRAHLHWNEEITSGVKYSVIAHNNSSRPLVYPSKKAASSPRALSAIQLDPSSEEAVDLSFALQDDLVDGSGHQPLE